MGRNPSVDIPDALIKSIIDEYNTSAKATVPYLAAKYSIGVYILNRRMKKEGVVFFKSGSHANRVYENRDLKFRANKKIYPFAHRCKIIEEELKKQKYQCAICHEKINSKNAKLDHCHKNGHYRAFLCNSCNLGLGLFRENKKFLRSAMVYIDKHKAKLNFLQKLKLKIKPK